jgi:hypothetical protein
MLAQAFVVLGLIDRAAGGRVPIEQSVCHVILDPKGSFNLTQDIGEIVEQFNGNRTSNRSGSSSVTL